MKKVILVSLISLMLLPLFAGAAVSVPTACVGVTFASNLRVGMSGPDVKCFQVLLNAHGYVLATSGPGSPGNETTYFGPRTLTSVRLWQKAQGWTPALQIGPLSRGKLSEWLSAYSTAQQNTQGTNQDTQQTTQNTQLTCTPNWQCGNWNSCSNSLQARTCTDVNNCGIFSGKPTTTQSCTTACTPIWQMGVWGVCANNQQVRTVSDANNCGVTTGQPSTTQSCTVSCTPNWQCGNWSTCTNSSQTRTCSDTNACGLATGQPSTTQSCIATCTPNWQTGAWGACTNNQQTRTVNDANSCGVSTGKPTDTQSCISVPAPTCNMTANSTSIIQGQSTTLTWNSNNANSASISGIGTVATSGSQSVSPTQNTTYIGTFVGQNNQTINCQVAISVIQPIAYWNFDNQGDVSAGLVRDQEGSYNAQNINGVSVSGGHSGAGLQFGAGSYSGTAMKVSSIPQIQQLTFSFWMKTDGSTNAAQEIIIANNWNFVTDYKNGVFDVGVPHGGLTTQPISVDQNYHFYTATYDGTNVTLYMDGQVIGFTTVANTGTTATGEWDFGIPGGSGTTNQITIDNVEIFNQVLSQNQIQVLAGI